MCTVQFKVIAKGKRRNKKKLNVNCISGRLFLTIEQSLSIDEWSVDLLFTFSGISVA